MVHVRAALGSAPIGIVLQQLDVELVEPTRGADVERAFAHLLDGGDPGKRQEEAEMIRELGEGAGDRFAGKQILRSEEHTSELQSLMRISYAVFCLKKKNSYLEIAYVTYRTKNTTTDNQLLLRKPK